MKNAKGAAGIVRRVDELGRVVIPKSLRQTHGIEENTEMEISGGPAGEIILKKYNPVSVCAGNDCSGEAVIFDPLPLCHTCLTKISMFTGGNVI